MKKILLFFLFVSFACGHSALDYKILGSSKNGNLTIVLKEKYGPYHEYKNILVVTQKKEGIYLGRKFKPTLFFSAFNFSVVEVIK
jgi:hypothetical protein